MPPVRFLITLFLALVMVRGGSEAGQPASLGKLLSKRYAMMNGQESVVILVSFTDKGKSTVPRGAGVSTLVSQKSLERRSKTREASRLVDVSDLPLEPSYVQAVRQEVLGLRHELKWFNAVSATATKEQIERVRTLPFVKNIELVGRWRVREDEEREVSPKEEEVSRSSGITALDYGASLTQLNQINVPSVHNLGIYGQGVVVGVFDNGFRLLSHESFASMNIIAQYDFVDHKTSVIPNNPSGGFGAHGVNTLSAIGGFKPGQLIGPAFKSSFILARTENDSSETPVEEDNWAKAIEWADSIGVDVTTTSLGYLTYDAPYPSWTWMDMDGATTLVTQAADHAASLGIVVLNSAGNDALARAGDPNTLIAPADGFDVITVGAVMSNGVRAAFSSYGPTFDGRTKPDIMAMGVNVRLASSSIVTGYVNGAGTSFSCPLAAGVAALLLCANPLLAPDEVAEALRQTANNFSSPDNLYGWGIVNALDALNHNAIIPMGHIGGQVRIDTDGDGIIDLGEPPATGVKILLSGTMSDSTYTDFSGAFSFDSLAIGTYTIRQVPSAGWIQTYPESSYTVSLLHGTDTTGFQFATFRLGTVQGLVFDDLNADGILDVGEPGLTGWRVRLFGPDTLSANSDSTGAFLFTGLLSGAYSLSESSSAGWTQTIPPLNGAYNVQIFSGTDTSGLLFGNAFDPAMNFHLIDNWNLLSLPRGVADGRKSALYPTAITEAFIYAGNYQQKETLSIGEGYWLKFPHAQNVHILGSPLVTETLAVKKGWNIIGALSSPIPLSGIEQIPPGIIISNYFGYNGTYQVADSLRPHAGYWVKTNAEGNLVAQSAVISPAMSSGGIDETSRLHWLTITDAKERTAKLYFGSMTGREVERYEAPPLPPEEGFDVRFASQRIAEDAVDGKRVRIQVFGGEYPLLVRTESVASGMTIEIEGANLPLSASRNVRIVRPPASLSLVFGRTPDESGLPVRTALGQNYPNPFNPTTDFGFRISDFGLVQLKVFDVLGREVAILVNEPLQPGDYKKSWDAGGLPSGMYYYRLTAGSFSDVKKMMLVK